MMGDLDEVFDARRQQARPRAVSQWRSVDPDVRDRRMLALHRRDSRSVAQIASHEGLAEGEVRAGIDRALQLEGSTLPDFAWEQAAPLQRARWASQPLE